jgi:uncharacterized protein YkwD
MEESPKSESTMTSDGSVTDRMAVFQEMREVLIRKMIALSRRFVGRTVFPIAILGACAIGTHWATIDASAQHSATRTPPPPADEFDPKTACARVVLAHNRLRADAKLPPLVTSAKLQAAAERHAKDMAAHGKMAHMGSDHSDPIDRIKATGYQYRRAGENIAAGRFAIERLMKGWMDSPHHKRNILGSFSQIGVAYATAEDGKRYWCVTFGLPARR